MLSRGSLQWTFLLVIREVDLSGEAGAAIRRASISSQSAHGFVGNTIRTMYSHWRVRTDMASDRSDTVVDVEPPALCMVWNSRRTVCICIRRYRRLDF
jgi:hypothetical protein